MDKKIAQVFRAIRVDLVQAAEVQDFERYEELGKLETALVDYGLAVGFTVEEIGDAQTGR